MSEHCYKSLKNNNNANPISWEIEMSITWCEWDDRDASYLFIYFMLKGFEQNLQFSAGNNMENRRKLEIHWFMVYFSVFW